jgi:hypothetical protein
VGIADNRKPKRAHSFLISLGNVINAGKQPCGVWPPKA